MQHKLSLARVAQNTAILIVLRVVMPAFGLLLVLALSRHLGAEGLGRYSLVFSILYFFNTLGPLGLNAIITREGARDRAGIQLILSNALLLSTIASVVLTIAMAGLGYVLDYDVQTRQALMLLSLSVVPFTIGLLFESVFVALEKMQHIAATMSIEYLFKVGVAVVLVYLGFGLQAVLVSAIVGRVLACALGVLLLRQEGIRISWRRDNATIERLLKLAPTFVMITVFASLYWRIDIVMLSKLQPIGEVGYYSAAYRVFDLAMVVPYSLCLALYPNVAAAAQSDRPLLATLGRSTMRYLVAMTLPAAVCTSVFSGPLLQLLYGPGFADAIPTLSALMWTLVFYGVVRYHAYVLVAANCQRVDLWLNIVMSAVNIGLNFVLIPRYSHLGAAFATLISILAYGAIQYWYLRTRLPGYAAPFSVPPIIPIASLAVGSMVWWMKDVNALLVIALAILVYGALLLAGGFFTRAELGLFTERLLRFKREGAG
jgi:O-antigen/teichoic acid export membrane protein